MAKETQASVAAAPAVQTAREQLEESVDLAAQDRPDTVPVARPRVTARDYVHTTHPDTGLDVVFVPGETLPQWLVDELEAGAVAAAVADAEAAATRERL